VTAPLRILPDDAGERDATMAEHRALVDQLRALDEKHNAECWESFAYGVLLGGFCAFIGFLMAGGVL
jgi:hypothetical protein